MTRPFLSPTYRVCFPGFSGFTPVLSHKYLFLWVVSETKVWFHLGFAGFSWLRSFPSATNAHLPLK
jgi:hypothetical protein